MDDFDTKPALASKGVWGGIIAVVVSATPPILKMLGLDDVITVGDLQSLLLAAAGVVGGALAIYGRIKAKKPIG